MERDAFVVGADGSGPAARGDDNLRHADPEPAADSELDSTLIEQMAGNRPRLSRWMGWRLRLLVGAALAGCVGLLLLAQHLADSPHVDAAWRADAQGRIELVSSADAALSGLQGQALLALGGGAVTSRPDALALQRSARWLIDDDQRARHRAMHEQLSQALSHEHVNLSFANGSVIEVPTQRRGYASLPSLFWVLAILALVLYLVAMVVVLAKPSARNLVYAIMSLCQVGNLVLIATESSLELALPAPFPRLDMSLRMAFDLVTAAAIVNAACLHPRRLPGSGWMALAAWVVAFTLVALGEAGGLPQMWWWTQASVALLGLAAIGLLSWSYQIEAHPFAIVLRRFGVVTLGTWVLLTLALAAAGTRPSVQHDIAATGSLIWYVFLASLLLLIPFLSKSQQIMREFSLLAAISTVATSLDLLFVAVFSLGQFASLTLSLFVSLGVYAGVRQWILSQLLGSSMLTTERTFEQLYRIAREVEAFPERTPALLAQLLRELFEPIEVNVIDKTLKSTRMASAGSALLVPVPRLSGDTATRGSSIVIRFAHRGRRLFTSEDVRLTERIVEQLRRAVAFDKAVEQGRSEERLRIAQDLHDDIGARLLTLMYKAQSPETEEYVRHTLQDLKTLTRGLAASNHRFSHAAAEWKADLSQRLAAAHIEFGWSCSFDDDALLSVVRWSALTRMLRELVSNAIAHSRAVRVDIELCLDTDRLELTVRDNGIGRNPQAWSHGLGLGGVRKRVKQLGGEVEWRECVPRGITCRIMVPALSARQ